MMIGSVGSGSGVPAGVYGAGQTMDSYSKNIQKQIEQTQKQMQELSQNSEMTAEEKMKKRQELQQKITDLNNQLRQHQMDLRREKQQEERALSEESTEMGKNGQSPAAGSGFSTTAMKAMVSADASMKQAQVQRGVAVSMKGRAGVLEAEIKQDAGRGQSVEAKKEELANVNQKAAAAEASQMSMLKEANGAWKKADADNEPKEDDAEEKTDSRQTEDAMNPDTENTQETDKIKDYKSIDILL